MSQAASGHGLRAAWVVILAGVSAALHVGKLPPAIPVLRDALGVGLLEAGFLLSLVQLAGMSLGLAVGLTADGIGLRRSMLTGLLVLVVASAGGGAAGSPAQLLALRALEGFGFLLVTLPAPSLVRRLVPPSRISAMLGVWGAYMPLGTALALLAGPSLMAAWGWSVWWWGLAGLSALMALLVCLLVPVDVRPAAGAADAAAAWQGRLGRTLRAPGPWLVALTFAMYSGQWLAVIGFLPAIYAQGGVTGPVAGALTAMAAAVNMVGNIGSGRLLQRGVRPPALLVAGFLAMAAGAWLAFGAGGGAQARFAGVLLFSSVGGLIPGTLFSLAVRLAPAEDTVSTTVGWMQQWSSIGQFAGPPAVAWLAARAGGWHWTWLATGACCLGGCVLAAGVARALVRRG